MAISQYKVRSTALTPKELEVLAMLCCGLSNKEIAAELVVKPQTLKNHLSSVYYKLDISSRLEAVCLTLPRVA